MLNKVGVMIGQTGESSTTTSLLVDYFNDGQGVCGRLDPFLCDISSGRYDGSKTIATRVIIAQIPNSSSQNKPKGAR